MNQQQKPIANDVNDLLVIVKTMWTNRRTIIIGVITGTILGLIFALLAPKEYSASTVIVPQMGNDSQSKLGGLSGLAALAGININMNQASELSPLIYPQIVGSIPFQLELMNTPLNFQDYPKSITLLDYYTKSGGTTSLIGTIRKYTIGLPGVLIKAIKGEPKELRLPSDSTNLPILLTSDQFKVQQIIDKLVTLDLNSKEGYILLTTRLSEALAAAQLAQKAQTLLQRYITEFKIEKGKADLSFIQGRYNEIKTEFEKAQVSLALVNDRNKNFTSGLPQIEADRIQTRYSIAYSVYQELAKQLEQAKIQVKKETPVFTIIQPVTVPSLRSKPKRTTILVIWIFLGGITSTIIVFSRDFITSNKKKWKEELKKMNTSE